MGVFAHVYGCTYSWTLLRRNIKNTILSFTNCDNHTKEIVIFLNTYSLELLHLTPFHFTAFTLLALILIFLHLFAVPKTTTPIVPSFALEGHISGL
jgi:hypothetical protein